MIDTNGWPGCRRERVPSVPVRSRCTSVRACSAKVGSGAIVSVGAPRWPCRLMPSSSLLDGDDSITSAREALRQALGIRHHEHREGSLAVAYGQLVTPVVRHV